MNFSKTLLEWYTHNKRVFPFREKKDAYSIWLSEIMLQQTRTQTVIEYYNRFISLFPDVFALADAKEETVLKAWEGLGYYSRARNLLKCAKAIANLYEGTFPKDAHALEKLPGIGPYTAAAIASIAYDEKYPAMDGNLTRVFARILGMREDVTIPSNRRTLYNFALSKMPNTGCGDFNQALMDIGATLCTVGTPRCERCPLSHFCDAFLAGDAGELPILPRKKPLKVEHLCVLIVTSQNKVYVEKRTEKLLQGLYVFVLCNEGEEQQALKKRNLHAGYQSDLGNAKHIFTHKVWQMKVMHYIADDCDERFVDLETLDALPFPTAVTHALKHAKKLIGK